MSELLVLSRAEVESLLTMDDCIKAMEQVFAASSQKMADSVGVLHFDIAKYGGGWSVKPGYLVDKGYVGVKMMCGYPDNVSKNLPTALGAILLSDATNGLPLAVLDGVYITGVRTGATGGVAAKYLARKDSRIIGVVGTGNQGRMQVLGLRNLFDIREIRVYDIDVGRRSVYAKEMTTKIGATVKEVDSPEAAIRGV